MMTGPPGGGLRGGLGEDLPTHGWLEQFRIWIEDADADPGVLEPRSMQLATVGADGHPAVRTVLVKAFDDRGLVFYTNLASAKAQELAAHPYAAAALVWVAHHRQIRLDGPVSRVDAAETDAYFATRPRGSQIGAWASPQSRPIASRAVLEDAVRELEQRFADAAVPTPPFWGGYRIAARNVEFWQGRADRLHDRVRYRHCDTGWVVERLAP